MSFLSTIPQLIADAAGDLAGIGSTISQANTAASAATTGVLPAAADEVSQAIAELFAGHGRAYQVLSAQVGRFHDQFVQLLTAGASSYATAEAANASPLQALLSAVAAPTTPLGQLQQGELGFDGNLVSGEMAFNQRLLTSEVGLERAIFGTDSALNGALNRGFNAFNLVLGTGEQGLDSLVGVQVPATFTAGLLTGSAAQVFNGGQIGGLEGIVDQSLMVPTDLAGLVLGNGSSAQALTSGLASTTNPLGAFELGLQNGELGFDGNLVNGQMAFNHTL